MGFLENDENRPRATYPHAAKLTAECYLEQQTEHHANGEVCRHRRNPAKVEN